MTTISCKGTFWPSKNTEKCSFRIWELKVYSNISWTSIRMHFGGLLLLFAFYLPPISSVLIIIPKNQPKIRMWGRPQHLRNPAHSCLCPDDHPHPSNLSPNDRQGCAGAIKPVTPVSANILSSGVWASSDLSTRKTSYRRRQRSWCLLHHPLCRHLREDRHEDGHLRDPPAGNPHQGQRHRLCQRHHVLQGEEASTPKNDDDNDDEMKVADATCAVANVDDYSGSSRLLAATTLRKV